MTLATSEVLRVRMYDFLILPIRDADQKEGDQFLERLCDGFQEQWEAIQGRIFSIKDLWSVVDCPDEYLTHLKRIVGWTSDLDRITDPLTYLQLRRLISASVALWKKRGPEDTIRDVLRLVTAQRVRIWNWFDFRWVLDETILGEDQQGRDPWVINIPGGAAASEYYLNVRLVDPQDGSVNRELVRELLKLMRPSGERIQVTWLKMLDQFLIEGDTSQWSFLNGDSPVVEDGHLKLTNTAAPYDMATFSGNGDPNSWTSYSVYARLRYTASGTLTDSDFFALLFHYSSTASQAYYAGLVPVGPTGTPYLYFGEAGAGPTEAVDLSAFGITSILQGVWYGLRAEIIYDAATGDNYIKVYLDGTLILNTTHSVYDVGGVGLLKLPAITTLECDVMETLAIPADTDTIGINP